MSSLRLPVELSSAVKSQMTGLGFTRIGRSYRKAVDPPGGLTLTWTEQDSIADLRGRRAEWVFAVLPRAFVEARLLIEGKETPFERLDPTICPAHMVFTGPSALRRQDVSYRPDDPDEVALFASALTEWLSWAVALGEEWLSDIGTMLDALDGEARRTPVADQRRYTDFGGLGPYRPVLELAAGRVEVARALNRALLISDDPELPRAKLEASVGRLWAEHYPELRP